MKKVSVVIPAYNRAPFLSEALRSVMEQTRRADEVVVVDDGSTDDTAGVVQEFPGVRYVFQENRGVSAARNLGVQRSTGEWIAFLDSDDLWVRTKLERQLEEAARYPASSIIHTDEVWIRSGRRINPGKRHMKHGGWIFERCLALCLISPSSVLVRRDALEKTGCFDEELPACEDYDLWLRLTLEYPVFFIPEPLVVKRGGHPDQLSHRYYGMDRFRILAMEKILRHPRLSPSQRIAVRREIQKKGLIYANGCLKRRRMDEYNRIVNRLQALVDAHEAPS